MNRPTTHHVRRALASAAAVAAGLLTVTLWPQPAPAVGPARLEQAARSAGPATFSWSKPIRVSGGNQMVAGMGKIPAGRYFASIDVWVAGTTLVNTFRCELHQLGRDQSLMQANGASLAENPRDYAVSATRLVTVTQGDGLYVRCYGAQLEDYRSFDRLPLQVTLTRVDETKRTFIQPPVTLSTTRVSATS